MLRALRWTNRRAPTWQCGGKSADSLATGSIIPDGRWRYDVRFRLWDVVRGQDLGGQSFVVTQGDLRLVAHRIADFIYEKLTGERGVFSTRITLRDQDRFSLQPLGGGCGW